MTDSATTHSSICYRNGSRFRFSAFGWSSVPGDMPTAHQAPEAVVSKELLNCPFCGQRPAVYEYCDNDGAEQWVVACGNDECGEVTFQRDTRQEAIDAWNRRHGAPPHDRPVLEFPDLLVGGERPAQPYL